MFDSIAKTLVDPKTGKPFNFGGSLPGLTDWRKMDPNGSDDNGNRGGLYDFIGSNVNDPAFLKSIGWTGEGSVATNGENGPAIDPGFLQYLNDNQLSLNRSIDPATQEHLMRAFDASGNAVGNETRWAQDDDPGNLFLMATLGAAGFGTAAALGAGAAGAGAANGSWDAVGGLQAGELSGGGLAGTGLPEYATYTGPSDFSTAGLGNTGGIDYGAANGSWDVAGGGGAAGSGLTPAQTAYGALENSNALAGGFGGAGTGGATAAGSSWIPGISNSTALQAGGGLLNSAIGAYSAGKATDAARDANAAADARLAPWYAAGTKALTGIDNLLSNPSSLASQPDYQFQYGEGLRAAQNGAASRGLAYSGAQDKALTKWGQGLASTKLNESFNRLATVAGLGQSAAGQGAANQLALGQTQGNAALYTGAVANNALNNLLGQYQYESQYKGR